MELAAGTAVDRFVVEGMIGRGGMASVYRIRHRTLNVAYALKVMHVTHPELADRIHSEGALQAELRHPNIVTVFDMIEVGGLPALVMEYVDGPSMAAMLEVHQPTLDQVDELVRGMLKGVRAAHAAGLIHRDIKPANVLLAHADDGYLPKITDFGLAKSLAGSAAAVQTRTGVVMGTPSYMAPEQFRNTRAVDARADIYSLGVVMYELCAGRRPYDEEDLFDLLDRVRNADYPRVTELVPSLPDRMADAIEGAMAVEPDERIATVDQLYDVWCGNARVDRSRVWNRAVLQQIGQSLSENQPEGIEVPGARSSQRKSGPHAAPAPIDQAPALASPPPELTVGPGTPGLGAAPAGPVPLDAAAVPSPGPLRLDAGLAGPAPATPSTLGLSPDAEPADEPDEPPAANDDRTRFEPIVRAMAPIVHSDPDASSDDLAETEKVRAVQPADERPVTEWVGEEDDDVPAAASPAAPSAAVPGPPMPPAALAQASILVPSEMPLAASTAPASAPPATSAETPPARKVSLTDSTPSLHLPGTTARSAGAAPARSASSAPSVPPVATGGLGRTVPVAAALLMVVLLLVGGGLLLVVGGGSVLYALTGTGEPESPLPVIEVPEGGEAPDGGASADPAEDPSGEDPGSADPGGDPGSAEPADPGADAPDAGDPPEVAPAPTPTPAPAKSRTPAPKVEKGTVELTGDARSIRLVSGGKSFGAGSVPVGTYELKATFPGQGELPQRATVTVRKGAKVTVNCVAGFFSCTVK